MIFFLKKCSSHLNEQKIKQQPQIVSAILVHRLGIAFFVLVSLVGNSPQDPMDRTDRVGTSPAAIRHTRSFAFLLLYLSISLPLLLSFGVLACFPIHKFLEFSRCIQSFFTFYSLGVK